MEILVFVLAPLFVGPFLAVFGVSQLAISRLQVSPSGVPAARAVRLSRGRAPKRSLRHRGRQNLALGLYLSIGLLVVVVALGEAAS